MTVNKMTRNPQQDSSTGSACRRLQLAHGVSVTGSEAQDFALLMLTTAAYGAVLSVGWLGFAMTIGALLLGPALATIQDRRPSQRGVLMYRIDAARAVLTLLICLTLVVAKGPVIVIYGVVVVLTISEVLFQAALRSSLPMLVRNDEDNANTVSRLNSSLLSHWAAVQVLVPPTFVALLTFAEVWMVILFNALTFAVSSSLLRAYALRIQLCYETQSVASNTAQTAVAATGAFWADVRQGIRVVVADRPVAAAMVVYAFTNAIGFAVLLSIPTLLTTSSGVDELAIGLAFASLSLGALVGAWAARHEAISHRPLHFLLAAPFLRAGALVGVSIIGSNAFVAGPLFLFGVAIGLSNVARLSFVQGRFHDEVLGRVMSLYAAANQLLLPVAALGGASAIRLVGAKGSYLLLGALAGLGGLGLLVVCRSAIRIRPCPRPNHPRK